MKIDRIVIITRKTRLEENIKRFNTKAQTKFYIESRGQSFEDYQLEYDIYMRSKETVKKSLPRDIQSQEIDRDFLPNFVFAENDLVLVLGQDGLVVNTAKYLKGQKVIAVNPDPDRFDGILLPFLVQDIINMIQKVENNDFQHKAITMAKVTLSDGQELHAFNDFFIGVANQTSARYSIEYRSQEERQISSGIIVSTPAGSTGWLSSLFNMTRGISQFSGLDSNIEKLNMQWDDRKLTFIVREPFHSNWSGIDIVAGLIEENENLILKSFMPEGGIIFSDGMTKDFIEFNSGAQANISLSEKSTDLII